MCGDGKESIREIRDGEIVGMNVPVIELDNVAPPDPDIP